MKKVVMASLMLFGFTVNAQFGPLGVPSPGIIDGIALGTHIPTKRMVPYPNVGERDVMWSKRVWSSIDLREKINHNLYYPMDEMQAGIWTRNSSRWSLWTIIRTHVLNGDLTLFSPYNPILMGLGATDGDQLKYPVKPTPGQNFYTDSVFREALSYYLAEIGPQGTIPEIDEDPMSPNFGDPIIIDYPDGTSGLQYADPDTTWIMSDEIVQYHLKEDWFIDKQRSVLDVRIIAIAPVKYTTEVNNGKRQITGVEEMFWLYFPHCRFVLNNYYTYNSKNDSQWMSFDDLFLKRRFNSVVYKESNIQDRDISDYRTGVEAIQEAEIIKEEIRGIEHDVWSF
ncbi:MAG: gliding motility associated protein GldN [Crocinitomicaceae bacterium]|jgi:gliding motility associated protien GldN